MSVFKVEATTKLNESGGVPCTRYGFCPIYGWWIALTLLLPIELIAFCVRFDTGTLESGQGWWAAAAGNTPVVGQLLIAVVAAMLVFSGDKLQGTLKLLANDTEGSTRNRLSFLGGHFLALGAFAVLTMEVLEGDLNASTLSLLKFITWGFTGITVAVLWAGALLPVKTWTHAIKSNTALVTGAILIGTTAWVAGAFSAALWTPLGRYTLWSVHRLLNFLSLETICDPETFVIGTQTFAVRVAPDCSGHQGMGMILVFLSAYIWFNRHKLRLPQALLLLPFGIAIIWVANVIRIVVLIAIGANGHPQIALGGFHSQAGWLAFNAIALGLVGASYRWRLFSFQGSIPADSKTTNPTAAYLLPFLSVLAITMTSIAVTADFDWLYPARVIVALGTLWFFRRYYMVETLSWSWAPILIGATVFVLWVVMAQIPTTGEHSSGLMPGADNLPIWLTFFWFTFRCVGYSITVPIVEELAFRGYLTRRLVTANFDDITLGHFHWIAFLGSSFLFGIMHGVNWIPGTLAGMLFAIALYRRGRLLDSIIAHATTNSLLAIYAIASGKWHLWT